MDSTDKKLPVIRPIFDLDCKISGTWIGQSTIITHLDDTTIITGLVWKNGVPTFMKKTADRYRPPPCSFDELPPVS